MLTPVLIGSNFVGFKSHKAVPLIGVVGKGGHARSIGVMTLCGRSGGRSVGRTVPGSCHPPAETAEKIAPVCQTGGWCKIAALPVTPHMRGEPPFQPGGESCRDPA